MPSTEAGGIYNEYEIPWLKFTELKKLLLAIYRVSKTFYHKFLKVRGCKNL